MKKLTKENVKETWSKNKKKIIIGGVATVAAIGGGVAWMALAKKYQKNSILEDQILGALDAIGDEDKKLKLPVYDTNEAVDFINKATQIDKEIVGEVLDSDFEYMVSKGIINGVEKTIDNVEVTQF